MLVFRAVNVGITKLGRFELVEKVMWASRSKVKMKKSQVKHTHRIHGTGIFTLHLS